MARRLGDPGTLAYAIAGYIPANHSPDFIPRQVELSTELIEVALAAGEPERAAEGYEHRATALIELGEMRRAKADVAALATTAQELRQPSQEWFVEVYGALVDLLEGRLTEAERSIEAALRVGERAQSWNAAVSYGLQLYLLRREQGRVSEIEDLVRRSVEEYPGYPIWRCVLAHMAGELGYVPEARHSPVRPRGRPDPSTRSGWSSAGFLAEAARLHSRTPSRRSPCTSPCAPTPTRIAIGCARGQHRLGLARASACWPPLRSWGDAEHHFVAALEVRRRTMSTVMGAAHAQRDYAAMLARPSRAQRRRSPGGSRPRARSSFTELGVAH